MCNGYQCQFSSEKVAFAICNVQRVASFWRKLRVQKSCLEYLRCDASFKMPNFGTLQYCIRCNFECKKFATSFLHLQVFCTQNLRQKLATQCKFWTQVFCAQNLHSQFSLFCFLRLNNQPRKFICLTQVSTLWCKFFAHVATLWWNFFAP